MRRHKTITTTTHLPACPSKGNPSDRLNRAKSFSVNIDTNAMDVATPGHNAAGYKTAAEHAHSTPLPTHTLLPPWLSTFHGNMPHFHDVALSSSLSGRANVDVAPRAAMPVTGDPPLVKLIGFDFAELYSSPDKPVSAEQQRVLARPSSNRYPRDSRFENDRARRVVTLPKRREYREFTCAPVSRDVLRRSAVGNGESGQVRIKQEDEDAGVNIKEENDGMRIRVEDEENPKETMTGFEHAEIAQCEGSGGAELQREGTTTANPITFSFGQALQPMPSRHSHMTRLNTGLASSRKRQRDDGGEQPSTPVRDKKKSRFTRLAHTSKQRQRKADAQAQAKSVDADDVMEDITARIPSFSISPNWKTNDIKDGTTASPTPASFQVISKQAQKRKRAELTRLDDGRQLEAHLLSQDKVELLPEDIARRMQMAVDFEALPTTKARAPVTRNVAYQPAALPSGRKPNQLARNYEEEVDDPPTFNAEDVAEYSPSEMTAGMSAAMDLEVLDVQTARQAVQHSTLYTPSAMAEREGDERLRDALVQPRMQMEGMRTYGAETTGYMIGAELDDIQELGEVVQHSPQDITTWMSAAMDMSTIVAKRNERPVRLSTFYQPAAVAARERKQQAHAAKLKRRKLARLGLLADGVKLAISMESLQPIEFTPEELSLQRSARRLRHKAREARRDGLDPTAAELEFADDVQELGEVVQHSPEEIARGLERAMNMHAVTAQSLRQAVQVSRFCHAAAVQEREERAAARRSRGRRGRVPAREMRTKGEAEDEMGDVERRFERTKLDDNEREVDVS